MNDIVCKTCGKIFISYNSNAEYCSQNCNPRVATTLKKGDKTIEQLTKEALEHHMSYGKYVSMLGI